MLTRVPNLRAVRTRKLITQTELEQLTGISRQNIIRIEQGGKARYDTVHALAQALNVSPVELVHKESHATP